jgi:hypothetical protein
MFGPTTQSLRETAFALIPQHHKNAVKRGIAFGNRLAPRPRMRPAFLIIGAQKAGTSSLFSYLMRHGGFLRPLLKDVYFFDQNYARGIDWYLSFFPSIGAQRARERRTGGAVVTGEAATHYLLHPLSPARVRVTFPDIRLVALLRDPAKRALSHFFHNRGFGREPLESALQAFEQEESRLAASDPADESFARFSYLAHGRYAEQLTRWFAHFPREQLLVVASERMFAEPDAHFRAICRFIGLPERSLDSYPPVGQGRNSRRDEDALAFARSYFRPHNAALYDLLGERFDWPDR